MDERRELAFIAGDGPPVEERVHRRQGVGGLAGLGNCEQQGVRAGHPLAVAKLRGVFHLHGDAGQIFEGMKRYAGDQSEGTVPQGPTITFEDEYIIEMGDMRIEVLHLGPAHSPGDISVWLPERRLVIAGDMAFHERIPPIFEDENIPDPYSSLQEYLNASLSGLTIPANSTMDYDSLDISLSMNTNTFLRSQVGRLGVNTTLTSTATYLWYDPDIYRPYSRTVRDNLRQLNFVNT